METRPSASSQSTSADDFGVSSFSYSTLSSNAEFSSDADGGTAVYSVPQQTLTAISNANSGVSVTDLLLPAPSASSTQLGPQNIVVVASGSGTSLAGNTGNVTFTSAGGNQPLLLNNLGGGQNTIITFHTLPLGDGMGGQELAIVADGNLQQASSTTATVDLSSPENAALLQSLLSQGVTLRMEDTAMLTSDRTNSVDMGQLIDFVPASVPSGLVTQEPTSDLSHLTSVADLSHEIPASMVTETETGTVLSSARLGVSSTSATVTQPSMEFTDETPIFSRVCATLNGDIFSSNKDLVVLDQLYGEEDNMQIAIDSQWGVTVEASLPALVRVHNRLKDMLNIPNPTHIQLNSVKPTSVLGTTSGNTSTPSSRPSTSVTSMPAKEKEREKRKVEEKGASCRLLLPLVTSRGRVVKVPSHLASGVTNTNDMFDSDDSEEDVKAPVIPPHRKRRGRPRKGTVAEALASAPNSYAVVKNENIAPPNVLADEENGFGSGEAGAESVLSKNGVSFVSRGDLSTRSNAENVPANRPGVLRKARHMIHVTQKTHMRRIYEGRIKFKFFCEQCSFKSKRESHFNKHMKLHESGEVEVHRCGDCDFKTIRLSHLRRHELLHKSSLLQCNICSYMTDTHQMLLKHTKLRHPNGQITTTTRQHLFRCEVCGHSSSNRQYFTRHLMRHAQDSNHSAVAGGPDGFQCPQCQRSFQRRVHLERHLRDVHGPQLRPHLCDICGKSFKRSDALQQHKVVHTSRTSRNYPFHCSKCSKGFRSQAHLKEHLTRHSSERPYLCQYCGASFKTPSVQRKHILSLHLRPRAHACPICSKKFNTPYALTRHHRTHKVGEQKDDAISEETPQEGVSVTEADQQVTTISLTMDDVGAAAHLEQVTTDGNVIAVTEADDALHVQQTTLVTDVMSTGMEEALGEGENTLQTQYIVQGNETATALFYLTGSL